MRLIQKLTTKRDFHLAQAGRYQELITMLESDGELQKGAGTRAASVADQARALAALPPINGHAPAKPKKRSTMSRAQRKAAGARMRKMWKTKRAMMLRGVRKGNKRAVAKRATATATPPRPISLKPSDAIPG